MTQGFFLFSPFSVVSENKAVSEAVGHHGWGSHFCDLVQLRCGWQSPQFC